MNSKYESIFGASGYSMSIKIKYNKNIPRIYIKNLLNIDSFILKSIKIYVKIIYCQGSGLKFPT